MLSLQAALLTLALTGTNDTVLLDFYGDYCMPCRQMAPTVDRLKALGYPIRKVNVQQDPALAARFGVTSIPCFIMLVDGREADRVVGGTTLARLERMCQKGAASQPRAKQAAPAPPGLAIPATHTEGTFAGAPVPPVGQTAPNEWRIADPVLPSTANHTRGPDAHLIAASVRLRIRDPDGHSCGSGTIIDARQGEALILTCAHLFRDSQGKGQIEVDLFGAAPAENIPGRLLRFDLESDVALLSIRPPGPVGVARVAPPDYRVQRGASVVNVGCNNGDAPTVRHSRVSSLNKFMGPPNIQVVGQPVQGRSGGGLFSEDGQVIGVCNAADPSDNEGLYAALASVYATLDEARLSYVYHDGTGRPQGTTLAADVPRMPKRMPAPDELVPVAATAPAAPADASARQASWQQLSVEERAALEEIQRRRVEGAEVICIIRSRTDPTARSEVIMLDKVSQAFRRQLAGQTSASGDTRRLTSLEIPSRPTSLSSPEAVRNPRPQATTTRRTAPTPGRPSPVVHAAWQPRWVAPTPSKQ